MLHLSFAIDISIMKLSYYQCFHNYSLFSSVAIIELHVMHGFSCRQHLDNYVSYMDDIFPFTLVKADVYFKVILM